MPDTDDLPTDDGPPLGPVSVVVSSAVNESTAHLLRRRMDVDAKQEKIGRILEEMGCEAVVLLVPAHVAWMTAGLNVRGLLAEGERPGVYTNGRQRWLLCASADTQRLFDDEIDGLGFQVKEWQWHVGRAGLLGELVAGKKIAVDRPFPNLPMINEKLRPDLRPLSAFEQDQYRELGATVTHAVEATGRNIARGVREDEVAGQVAHRLLHRGVEPASLSITADGRGEKYRRTGYTAIPVEHSCVIQATGQRDGLFVTVARTVCFGSPHDTFRNAYDTACKISAVDRSLSVVGESLGSVVEAGRWLLANSPYEYEGRFSLPGYGTGRFPAEELRRGGHDEKFAAGQALVWQPRIGPTAVVDTLLVTERGPVAVTPPEVWPYKRITLKETSIDVPDLLVRSG